MKSNRHREIVVPAGEIKRELKRRTRRDFLIGGMAALAGIGGYEWLTHAPEENGVPWPQRRVLGLNGKIAEAYLSDSHLMKAYSPADVGFLKPNGDIGLTGSFDPADWSLNVKSSDAGPALKLGLSDIMALPKVEMITRFCCIEGWSTVVHWGGARFSDFTKKFFPRGQELPPYVYMATPGEDYYVGLDIKSALHPQTLLAYQQNGKPLSEEHGAPLRLAIPVKYGIKNIKRIGLIQYSAKQPGDYWAEEGYDWFAGL